MIRWKTQGDTSGIVRLVRTELVPVSNWPHPRDARLSRDISSRLRKGQTLVVPRSRRSEPIAFLHLIVQDRTLYIDMLAVDRRYQNRRWGSQLIARAEQYAREKQCASAHVLVDDTNERAIRFYEKAGYSLYRHLEALKCYELAKTL